jgi:hypothetical protein
VGRPASEDRAAVSPPRRRNPRAAVLAQLSRFKQANERPDRKVAEVKPEETGELVKIPQTGESSTAQTLGLHVPDTALIPDGSTFHEGDDDGKCRVIRPDGRRCGAVRMRAYGICPGHAGVGGVATSPREHSLRAHAEKRKRASARAVLGISARRAASPLQAARVAAQIRADDYATALVDAPLDDPELGSVARQQAAVRALELLYPQVTARLEVEMPADPSEVEGMGWQDMQAMAARLLTSPDQ